MVLNRSSYPAKVLLFGEYTVLHGSEAIALPIKTERFTGKWMFYDNPEQREYKLQSWINYLKESIGNDVAFDFLGIEREIEEGLHFKSYIPEGYGMGSSGALCAATLDRFGHDLNKLSIEEIKLVLAKMESFFHESSSGLDPLVSYYNRGFKIGKDKTAYMLDEESSQYVKDFSLLNSQKKRRTADWVALYKSKLKDPTFSAAMSEIALAQQHAITLWENRNEYKLHQAIKLISELQWTWMQEWIPDTIKRIWKNGLDTHLFSVKLCGAGGGGFFLLYSPDPEVADRYDTVPL